MSPWVLDTDHLSLFQRGHLHVVSRVLETSPTSLAITIIAAEEQLRGRLNQIRKAQTEETVVAAYQRLRELLDILGSASLLDYTEEAEIRYRDLRREKIRIGTRDLRIAAIALSTSSTLVTRNSREFGRVPGLHLEDWSVLNEA